MKKVQARVLGLESFTVARETRFMYIKGLGKSVLAFCLFISNFSPPKELWLLTKIYHTQKQNDKIIEGVKPKGKYK